LALPALLIFLAMADTRLPTTEEISELPRWAVVAFAARCARRVQPQFKSHWPDAPARHLNAIERTLQFAEDEAELSSNFTKGTNTDIEAAVRAAIPNADDTAYAAARTAEFALLTALRAANAARGLPRYGNANAAMSAADTARYADAAANGDDVTKFAIWTDYDTLSQAWKAGRWNDSTPVPPSVFGPMWPNGAPLGWSSPEPEQKKATDTASTGEAPLVIAGPNAPETPSSAEANALIRAMERLLPEIRTKGPSSALLLYTLLQLPGTIAHSHLIGLPDQLQNAGQSPISSTIIGDCPSFIGDCPSFL
jgi:hypothetical protein